MTVTVNITGLEPISEAINSLAKALGYLGGVVTTFREVPDGFEPAEKAPFDREPVTPAAPIPQAPVQQAAPVTMASCVPAAQIQPTPAQAPAVPAQPMVPTSAKTYTTDELSRAAMGLMDAGRQNDLIGLLQQFGVRSLPDLPAEQYGAFATALRGLGAQI